MFYPFSPKNLHNFWIKWHTVYVLFGVFNYMLNSLYVGEIKQHCYSKSVM